MTAKDKTCPYCGFDNAALKARIAELEEERRWRTEANPTESGWYLTTYECAYEDGRWSGHYHYDVSHKRWQERGTDGRLHAIHPAFIILAWRPMPRPYQEGQ